MDLDQAMLLMAQALELPCEGDLTEQVRVMLMSALVGKKVPAVRGQLAAEFNSWLDAVRARGEDPLGTLYQELLQKCLVPAGDGTWRVVRRREGHRKAGAYYTHPAVVQYILDRVQEVLPAAVTAVDPACGTGAFLGAAERRRQFKRLVGVDIDPLALQVCQADLAGVELYRQDALLDPLPGGFDVCIGNPPYISSGLRGMPRLGREQSLALRERFPHTAEYKLNTYPLFVERGLELLREGGVLAYILPDSFLSGRYFAGLRRLLLRHTLLELTLIRQDFWQHGRVGQSVILLVQKGKAPPAHQVTVRVCDRMEDLAGTSFVSLPLSEVVWGSPQRLRLLPDAETRALVRQMESIEGSRPLGALVRSYSGLIGRNGQRSLLRSENPDLKGPWGRLLRSGREIDRYRIEWGGEEVCLDPARIKSGGSLSHYQNPKLMLRQTADAPRVVLDEEGFFCLNNIHLLIASARTTNLYVLLGLLNSAPVARYYRALTMEAGRLYPQVDLDLLADIPVPPIPSETEQQLADLVLARRKAAPAEAASMELVIDEMISRLYGLQA